jgi:hypothetical protein
VGRMCSALSAAVAGGLSFPNTGRVVLAAELGRFAADADTAPGFRKRRHNRCASEQRAGPGAVAAERRRSTGTGSSDVPILPYSGAPVNRALCWILRFALAMTSTSDHCLPVPLVTHPSVAEVLDMLLLHCSAGAVVVLKAAVDDHSDRLLG